MKALKKILKNYRSSNKPVYSQLELPLGGMSLSREDSKFVLDLRRIRESLAGN
ncbi:MAG: hypothetical protein ACK5LK_01425 [Chthoniobacterales bacterium]